MVLTVSVGLAGPNQTADSPQPPAAAGNNNPASSPKLRAGIYEGCLAGRTNRADELKVLRESRVLIEFKETRPGVYDGVGAVFNMRTEPPKALYELKPQYDQASGVFLCSIEVLGQSLTFKGGIQIDSSGDEYLQAKATANSNGGELEITLWRQEHEPEKVSQGAISIETANMDPAKTTADNPPTLRYEFRARDIVEAPFKFDEKLTVTGPDGVKNTFSGGTQQLDYQHGLQGPSSMDAHCVRVCQLPALTKPGDYICHIELTASGYTKEGKRDVAFQVVESTNAEPVSSSHADYWAKRRKRLVGKDAELFRDRFKGGRDVGSSQTNAPETTTNEEPARLNIRMAAPYLELVPGDIGQIDGVYVSDWKRNCGDRVEADLGVVDVGGDLKVNRRINAAPGDTSAMPFNMDGPEYYFSEIWTAKIGARPGLTRVPIIVRQGSGSAGIFLSVSILPPNTRLASPGWATFLNMAGVTASNVRASNQISAAPSANPLGIDLQPANDLFKQRRYADALQLLDSIVAAHPESRDARFFRGRVRIWLNDLRGARDDFLLLARQNPADYESQRRILEIELILGDRRAVLEKASALAKAQPDNLMLSCIYAYAAAVNHDTETAERFFAKVVKKAPTLSGNFYEEARAMQQAGVPLMAIQGYQIALWLKPSDHRPYYDIGTVYAGLGERDKAIDAFQRLLRLEPAGDLAEHARQQLNKLGATN